MKKKQLLTLALAVAVLLSTIGFSVKAFASIAETPSRIVTADWELAEAIQEAIPLQAVEQAAVPAILPVIHPTASELMNPLGM